MLPFGFSDQSQSLEIPELLRKLNLSGQHDPLSHLSGNDGLSEFFGDASRTGTESIQVRVPTSEHVAEIVGKQGCKIKSLRYSTKTYIQTPAREQEPVFTICGYPGDVERAKRRIEEAADHFTKIRQGRENNSPITPQLGPNAVVRHVRVPLKYVGLVVGPKGHNIKRIQSETDTFIMTPARDKEPIFEIRGAPDKVAEAENKLQMYIAMRTGGMFDDPDHLVDVDLKKPMVPPKPLDPFFAAAATAPLGGNWPRTDAPYSPSFAGYEQMGVYPRQENKPVESGDSGYSSPNYDQRDLQALRLVIDQIQQSMQQPQLQNQNQLQNLNQTQQQQQQAGNPVFANGRWF